MSHSKYGLKVTSPFLVNGKWIWPTWIDAECGGNSHAAIIDKAKELGAKAWAFDQGTTELVRVAS